MSQPAFKRHPFDDATDTELARWPGVTSDREHGSKHLCLIVSFEGRSRQVWYATTPGDNWRGAANHLRTLRKELRELGAVRMALPKSSRPARRTARTRRAELNVILGPPSHERGPLNDPWAALAAWRIAEEPAPIPTAQPPRKSLLRRLLDWLTRQDPKSPDQRMEAE